MCCVILLPFNLACCCVFTLAQCAGVGTCDISYFSSLSFLLANDALPSQRDKQDLRQCVPKHDTELCCRKKNTSSSIVLMIQCQRNCILGTCRLFFWVILINLPGKNVARVKPRSECVSRICPVYPKDYP